MVTTISVGITAYNEEKAMPRLLKSIIRQKIPSNYELIEILIVSSACTDRTNEIIRSFQKKDPRINLIEEAEKHGKPAALNKIISIFKGDILIMSGADCMYGSDALYWMLKDYDYNHVGAVSGHPVPLNPKNSLWGYAAHMLWGMHHYMCLNYANKLSGELCSIKREYIENVPQVGGDDVFLERVVKQKKGKIKYQPKSLVYILGPQSATDYFKQRRRVIGHLRKAEMVTNLKGPTTTYSKIMKTMLLNLRTYMSIYTPPILVVEMLARIMASWDLKTGKIKANWDVVKTTK